MQTLKTAVILAAGMGTRLRSIFNGKPKGLLEIGGKTLIKESLRRITLGGITDIIIVTGYSADHYQRELAEEYPQIRYIPNREYDTTGSMHSLFQVRKLITSDFLLLESDLLYEDRCISALIQSKHKTEILISGKTGSGDEVYVFGENNKVSFINKAKSETLTCQGELVGISKLHLMFFAQLCEYYESNLVKLQNAHYEECISDLSLTHLVHYLKIPDIIWTEIDNPDHYRRALKEIFPRIYGVSAPGV